MLPRPDDRAGPAGAPAVRQRARAIAGRPRPGRGSCSPRPRPRLQRAATKPSSTDATTTTSTAPSHTPSTPPRELIEDACQTAWSILLRTQPERYAIFAWLRVVAIHEAYRLKAIERRTTRLASHRADHRDGEDLVADPHTLDDALEALEALRALAALPGRQRLDHTLKVAGFTYEEIRILTGGRTFTNVNKSLVKGRRRIRRSRSRVA